MYISWVFGHRVKLADQWPCTQSMPLVNLLATFLDEAHLKYSSIKSDKSPSWRWLGLIQTQIYTFQIYLFVLMTEDKDV